MRSDFFPMQCENIWVFPHGHNYLIEPRKQPVFINIFKPMKKSFGIAVSGDLPNYPVWRE
jgi:hypothetical protein